MKKGEDEKFRKNPKISEFEIYDGENFVKD